MSLESIPSWPFPLITLLITLGLPVPVYLPFGPPLHIARLIVLLQLELCHRPTHKILAVPRCCQIKSKLYTLVFCTLILPYLRASWFPLTLPSKSLPIIEGLCPFVYLLHEDFLDSLKLKTDPEHFFGPYLSLNQGTYFTSLLKCVLLKGRNEWLPHLPWILTLMDVKILKIDSKLMIIRVWC